MAKCKNCGKVVPYFANLPKYDTFATTSLCDDCYEASERMFRAQLAHIEESIKTSHRCTPNQEEVLKPNALGCIQSSRA